MKLIVSGGGTGGHFFPALEILRRARERNLDTLFVGTRRGIEVRYEEEIPGNRLFLETYPFRGVSLFGKLKSLKELIRSTLGLRSRVEGDFRAVILGGYPSVPVALLTLMRRKNLYIHEQNSVPSATNRSFALFARKIFITFEYTRSYFRGRHVIRTGLPVRSELLQSRTERRRAKELLGLDPDREVVLFMGGSQGAVFLNDMALEFARRTGLETLLLSGERDYERVREAGRGVPNLRTFPFRRDMGTVYSAVNAAVCRAGAGTIGELSCFRVPALFIPYPYAAGNHQFYNAKEIEDLGGGFVLRQEEATPEKVIRYVERILADREVMAEGIGRFSSPSASAVILDHILQD